ncbi:MAG TPA: hypothetical protein VMJ12_08570 [Candidatus Acidoferrales bacterium]|nr:hypothetical protein [Candidatus Acidoferrales bacterium]
MKQVLIGLLIFGVASVYGDGALSLERAGVPFVPVNAEITWGVPTNQQPMELWVYRTIPQNFSPNAISNLMALGSFTTNDQRKLTAEEGAIDKNALAFVTKDENRSLGISPALGWIIYKDNRAFDVRDKIQGVPSDAKAKKLALKLLDEIGIPRSELVKESKNGEPLTFRETGTRGPTYHTKTKTTTGKNEIDSRGVFFIRQIEGVSFAGIGVAGGFYVRFVSRAKVQELELVWRNLQRWKEFQVASPDQIVQWIKEGRAVMPAPNVNPNEVIKLTITQISPLYMGELGGKRQDFTYPFGSLNAIADLGRTNVNLQLYCPILSMNDSTSP